jgi:hypothetical protein
VAGVAFVGFLMARRAGVGPPSSPLTETAPASAPVEPAGAGAVRARLPSLPSVPSTTPPDQAPAALTPLGASRALQAINRNEQTRQLFDRLQRVGLSREQLDRVLLILGTQALRPAEQSPTLVALRADGRSRVLSDDEANRVRDERRQIAERALRPLRPALAAVLTPAQFAKAGLGGDDTASASKGDRR